MLYDVSITKKQSDLFSIKQKENKSGLNYFLVKVRKPACEAASFPAC